MEIPKGFYSLYYEYGAQGQIDGKVLYALDLMREMSETLKVSRQPLIFEYNNCEKAHILNKIEEVLKKFKDWK